MHVAINIESNRLQAATVDMDGNVLVYKIGEGLNSTKTEIPCNIYLKGINAYVGDIVDLIKYEDPNINNDENFVLELSNANYVYKDNVDRKWTALYLLGIVLSKLRKDIEINTMQTINSCSLGMSPLYNDINVTDLKTAVQYNRLKLIHSYDHISCASLFLIHKYQLNHPASIIYFFGDWNYIQIGISEISNRDIIHQSDLSIKIDSIQSVKGFLIDFIKKCYEDQTGEAIVLHATNLVVINKIINTVIDKFYFRNEEIYENTIIINNNIVSINLNKVDLEEINTSIRNNILERFNAVIEAHSKPDQIHDYIIFTGRLGSIFFFREIFEKMEKPLWKEKVFSTKNDILVKGLALFDYEAYKKIRISSNHSKPSEGILKLNISCLGLEKTYDISSLADNTNQTITITNLLEDGLIKNLSNEECEFEIIEHNGRTEKKIGQLKLELPLAYSLSHFQLSCKIDQRGKLSFKAYDVFNGIDIITHFEQESATKRINLKGNVDIGSSKKDLIKLKTNIGSNKRIKILSKNGNGLSQGELVQKSNPKKIRIGAGVVENKPEKLKITISKSDLKERPESKTNGQKISKNESTIVEDFHELIRIIVINNSP